jgi:Protein of unknown function (DUF3631)/Toprim domain
MPRPYTRSTRSRQPKPTLPVGWNPQLSARLDSWLAEILHDLRPDISVQVAADGTLRSEAIVVYSDHWYDYGEGLWGQNALDLVVALKGEIEGNAYVGRWLAGHQGKGSWQGIDTEAGLEQARKRAEIATHLLKHRQAISRSPAEKYLEQERHIPVREGLVGLIGYIPPDNVLKDHAFAGVLVDSADPEVVLGIQIGFLTPKGEHVRDKGSRLRRSYYSSLDPEARRRACFYVPAMPLPNDGPIPDGADLAGATIIVEGLENTIAVASVAPYSTVLGLPGIGRLATIAVPDAIIVLRDNDGEDAQATKVLRKGLDALLLAGCKVLVTETPEGADAADYIQAEEGVDLLDLIRGAVPAEYTRDGELQRLAELPWEDYQTERRAAARRLKWTTKALDAAVAARRPQSDDSRGEDSFTGVRASDDKWPEPVTDIASVCDTALAQLQRYVVADPGELAAALLWALHAHVVHHPVIVLDISPRLLFEAIDAECGKTTGLEALSCLTPRHLRIGPRLSASALVSLADTYHVTLFVDEFDKLLRHRNSGPLADVLLASHRRAEADVPLQVPAANGKGWVTELKHVWLTYAGTAIAGKIKDEGTRSRFIVVALSRATKAEAKKLRHLRLGRCSVLDEVRQKFARWTADLTTLPAVEVPDEVYSRRADNWNPLLSLAAVIGGHWPETIYRQAVRVAAEARADDDANLPRAFLRDLHRVLHPEGKPPLRGIWTKDIAARLLELDSPSADWTCAYRGGEITEYWSSRMLALWLRTTKDKARQLKRGGRNLQGVYTEQLQKAFAQFLGEGSGEDTHTAAAPYPSPAAPTPLHSANHTTTSNGYKVEEEISPSPTYEASPTFTAAQAPDEGNIVGQNPGKGRGAKKVAEGAIPSPTLQHADNNDELDKSRGVGAVGEGQSASAIRVPSPAPSGHAAVAKTPASRSRKRKLNGAEPTPEEKEREERKKLPDRTEEW